MRINKIFIVLLFLVFSSGYIYGFFSPCLKEDHKQITFLLGEWVVKSRVKLADNSWEETQAVSKISPVTGGCALLEEWSGKMRGQPFQFTSLTAYNPRTEKWEQVSVDTAHGNLNKMEGGIIGEEIRLFYSQIRGGRLLLDRIIIKKTDANSFYWKLESSFDGGKNWAMIWSMSYKKKDENRAL